MEDSGSSAGVSSISDKSSTPAMSGPRVPDYSLPSPPRSPIFKQHSIFLPVLQRYTSTADESIVRLRRLLSTTAGLDSFLSTINYLLYLLAYLETRSPLTLAFLQRLHKLTNSQPAVSLFPPSPSGSSYLKRPQAAPLGALGRVISEARITLRLTALIPLYTWLRELLADKERQDRYIRAISLLQCTSYIIYQSTENVAFLADHGIISQKWLGKRGELRKWWLWSSRAWLAGVSCDFLKLFRKAMIEREKGLIARQSRQGKTEADLEEQRSIDKMWWREMFVASCWFPICLHYSLQSGLDGVNTGVIGLLGFLAGAQSLTVQWADTKTS